MERNRGREGETREEGDRGMEWEGRREMGGGGRREREVRGEGKKGRKGRKVVTDTHLLLALA